MVPDIENTMLYLQQSGFLELFLPFFIIYGVLYAAMGTISIFKPNKIRGLLSLTISLAIVIPHVLGTYPPGTDVVVMINNILPVSFLVILAVFITLIFLSIMTKQESIKDSPLFGLVAVLGLFILVYVMVSALDPELIPAWLYFFLGNPTIQVLLLIGAIIFLIHFFVFRETPKESFIKRAHKVLKDLTGEK